MFGLLKLPKIVLTRVLQLHVFISCVVWRRIIWHFIVENMTGGKKKRALQRPPLAPPESPSGKQYLKKVMVSSWVKITKENVGEEKVGEGQGVPPGPWPPTAHRLKVLFDPGDSSQHHSRPPPDLLLLPYRVEVDITPPRAGNRRHGSRQADLRPPRKNGWHQATRPAESGAG
jgi:hypothetical protein